MSDRTPERWIFSEREPVLLQSRERGGEICALQRPESPVNTCLDLTPGSSATATQRKPARACENPRIASKGPWSAKASSTFATLFSRLLYTLLRVHREGCRARRQSEWQVTSLARSEARWGGTAGLAKAP